VQKSRAFVAIGERFHDRWEDLHMKEANRLARESGQGAYDIINLMLPKGVPPPGGIARVDFWHKDVKGSTPLERMARARRRTQKAMNGIMSHSYRGAARKVAEEFEDVVDNALAAWQGTEAYVEMLADNDGWLAGLINMAATFDESDDVIDHYEHKATLDELTCEECAALDGTEIPTSGPDLPGAEASSEMEAWAYVDVHPRCRCIPVPVTKTWEELGFPPLEDPEGTRIARPYYPVDEDGKRDWGKSSPGADSVQGYVPADVRYRDWEKNKGEMTR
jgi:hypothetical protein